LLQPKPPRLRGLATAASDPRIVGALVSLNTAFIGLLTLVAR
jgi:hypothetical protein